MPATDHFPVPWAEAPPGAPTDEAIAALCAAEDGGELQPELYAEADRWRVADLADAEWAMARLADAQARLQAISDQANEWADKITEWARTAGRRDQATVSYMEHQLARWALAQRAANPRAATFSLPSGTVATRRVAEGLDVTDEPALLAYLISQPELPAEVVENRPRIMKAQLPAVLRISERLVGWLCTHRDGTATVHPGDADGKPQPGDLVDGRPVVKVEPLTERVVVGPDGTEVPGVAVRAERISATVTPERKALPR